MSKTTKYVVGISATLFLCALVGGLTGLAGIPAPLSGLMAFPVVLFGGRLTCDWAEA
jgi:hypothetical protein